MNSEQKWILNEKYKGQKTEGFLSDLKRLKSGEPLGYIIGHIPFLNTKIYLDSQPLIPRSETEFWTEKAIAEIMNSKITEPKILDLCAGSGCIGIAVLKAIPMVRVDLVEIDPHHNSTINRTIQYNKIEYARTQIITSDLFSEVTEKYDFILTNPPYIDPVLDRTEESVKNHEPDTALYGGKLGLELIEKIISEAPKYLTKASVLYIEHEPEQACAICLIGSKSGFTSQCFSDQYGNARYTRLSITSSV